MIVLGILGGVASGKSSVCEQFQRLGADWIQADQLGHAVLRDPTVREILRERWGPGVLDADGQIDRAAVARLVFAPAPAGPRQRQFLEQVTHPRIGERLRARLRELAESNPDQVVVLDAALLLEAGWERWCDALVFVDAPRTARLERARRRGWSDGELTAREAVQLPLETKRSRATWILDNSTTPDALAAGVEQIWRALREKPLAPRSTPRFVTEPSAEQPVAEQPMADNRTND